VWILDFGEGTPRLLFSAVLMFDVTSVAVYDRTPRSEFHSVAWLLLRDVEVEIVDRVLLYIRKIL
jgi:hypothetical protein